MKPRRSHMRIVTECYLALKHDDGARYDTILRKYGQKTRSEAIEMLRQDYIEKWGTDPLAAN